MSWKIHCVGVGSAFTDDRYWQSNFMIESASGKRLLVDCGGDIRHSLRDYGINNSNVGDEIDGVYVSHLHADHIGGLEWLAFCTYFNPTVERPKLYCVTGLMRDLWNKSLRGGLESVQGKECTLTDFFEGHPVKINSTFLWEMLEFTPVQTVHIMNGMEIISSYGLLIQEQIVDGAGGLDFDGIGPKVFITTDTQFCPNQIKDFYNAADVILHDCETAPFKSGVHAHYHELMTLYDNVKAKMWLYHYQPESGAVLERSKVAIKDGFLGFLERGQVLEFGEAKS